MSDNIVLVQETVQTIEVRETTAAPIVYATAGQINSGSGATAIVTPEALAASNYRTRAAEVWVIEATATCATGDGKNYFRVPSILNGFSLSNPSATCITAGTTGTMSVQIRNVTGAVDMLSTKITIDSGETDSLTALAQPVVKSDGSEVVATGNMLAIDIDTVHTTPAEGLLVTMEFIP